MSDKTLVKILRFGIFAVALIPLVIFRDYVSPFHFGKVVVFRTLIELMLPLYLVLVLKDRRYLPPINFIFWAFLAFTGAFTLTTVFSVQVYESFWGTLERMGGLFTFWHYFGFYIILTGLFKKKEDWYKLFNLMIFVGVLSAFYGFLQKTDLSWVMGSGGRTRIFGTIGNAALFGGYQLLVMFLAITMSLRQGISHNRRYFYYFAALITAIAVLMTAVRGSILGLGVGVLTLGFLYFLYSGSAKAKSVFYKLLGGVIGLAILVLALRVGGVVEPGSYLYRITDYSISGTVQTRLWAWEAGLTGWKESAKTMTLGWGPENFNIPFSRNFNPKFFEGSGSETLFDRAHNMYLEILITMGVVGLLAYLSIFYGIFKNLRTKLKEPGEDRVLAVGLSAGVVAYAIHNAFIFDTSANFMTFFTILGFISFLVPAKLEADKKAGVVNKSWHTPVLWLVVIVALFGVYKANVIPAKANYAATRGILAFVANDFTAAVSKFKEAITYEAPGVYEYRHNFSQYLAEETAGRPLTEEEKEAVKYAVSEVEKNRPGRPYDYLPPLYLARLNIILGRGEPTSPHNDTALDMAMTALEISPTFVRTYFEVAQAYLNKDDMESAREWFQKAVDLNPETGVSNWYLGIVEMELGNMDRALEFIEKAIMYGYAPAEEENLRLVNIYNSRNEFEKSVLSLERLVRQAPGNAQYHASLAAGYARVGRIDEAVTQARESVKIDPSFAPEAKAFVESLGRTW